MMKLRNAGYLLLMTWIWSCPSGFAKDSVQESNDSCSQLQSEIHKLKDDVAALKALVGRSDTGVPASCGQLAQDEASVGVSCRTSAGIDFVRYRDSKTGALGWKDTKDGGKIWYDHVKTNLNQIDASKFCDSKSGLTLPSRKDFETAEKHGFREILRSMTGRHSWSSTVKKDYSELLKKRFEYAYNFFGTGPECKDKASRKRRDKDGDRARTRPISGHEPDDAQGARKVDPNDDVNRSPAISPREPEDDNCANDQFEFRTATFETATARCVNGR